MKKPRVGLAQEVETDDPLPGQHYPGSRTSSPSCRESMTLKALFVAINQSLTTAIDSLITDPGHILSPDPGHMLRADPGPTLSPDPGHTLSPD